MNQSAVINQIAAILRNIAGITVSRNYNDIPVRLNSEELPQAVPLYGPLARSVDAGVGGRANWVMDESQTIPVRLYLAPCKTGLVSQTITTAGTLIPLILNAFDARPKLVNADGSTPDDFDWKTIGVRRAAITAHSGLTIEQFSGVAYFAVTFTIITDGQRVTAKAEGN